MAAVPLFRNTNMAAVTSHENTPLTNILRLFQDDKNQIITTNVWVRQVCVVFFSVTAKMFLPPPQTAYFNKYIKKRLK